MPIRTVARRSNRQPDVREYFPLARQLRFGNLADIHVLDTRQFRTDQPAGDGFGSTAVPDPTVAATLEAVFGEELFDRNGIVDTQATLLGWPQELRLAFALATSRSRWNVIAQQIMVMPWNLRTTGLLTVQFGPDFPGKQQVLADIASLDDLLNVDAWDGYQAARDRLDRLLAKARPNNPVFLTGDIHSGWAANLLDDYADPANSDVLAAEFVCTSISSTFASADPRPTDAIVRAGIPDNPHIRYFDGRFRGYCLCDVDRQRWRTEYRAVGAPENLLDPAGDALIPMQDDSLFTVAVAEIESGFNTPGSPKGVQVSSIV
jgi:alkaline phosphatase D